MRTPTTQIYGLGYTVSMDHDQSYKLLFSHAELVADLLRGFVCEDWVKTLDFINLEKMSSSYVADDLRSREDNVIWRVRGGKTGCMSICFSNFNRRWIGSWRCRS
jgi:Putative transposase, YhgA-like